MTIYYTTDITSLVKEEVVHCCECENNILVNKIVKNVNATDCQSSMQNNYLFYTGSH